MSDHSSVGVRPTVDGSFWQPGRSGHPSSVNPSRGPSPGAPQWPERANPIAERDTAPSMSPSSSRISAIDLTRTVAVLGMVASHIGPAVREDMDPWQFLRQIQGRSAGAFAILLGTSAVLALDSRRTRVGAWRAAVEHVARAVVLFGIGVALTEIPSGVVVVLAFLAVASVLLLPLVRVRARTLLLIAGLLLAVGPPFSYWIRSSVWDQYENRRFVGVPRVESFTSWSGFGRMLQDLFILGGYPLITWMPLALIGAAVARSDLRSSRSRVWIVVAGIVLLATRFALFPLLRSLFDLDRAAATDIAQTLGLGQEEARDFLTRLAPGSAYPFSWRLLLYPSAHSGTWFELAGIIGVFCVVLWVALHLGDRFPKAAHVLASPGRCALSIYVGHLVARKLLVRETFRGFQGADEMQTLLVVIAFALLGSILWSRFLGQGPLERLLRFVSRGAGSLVRSRPPTVSA